MITDVSQEAEELQRQAEVVLQESKVVDVFASLGDVRFAGSYCLQLMARPDIDIIVAAKAPRREEAVKATKRLLDEGYFQSVLFIDHFSWEKRLDAGMDARGFYWHLDVPRFGAQWKCDVWYLAPEEDLFAPQTARFEAMLKENLDARRTILRLKHELREGKGYRAGVTGTKICQAVLEHGIHDPESLMVDLEHDGGAA
jgi:hypothetical protein